MDQEAVILYSDELYQLHSKELRAVLKLLKVKAKKSASKSEMLAALSVSNSNGTLTAATTDHLSNVQLQRLLSLYESPAPSFGSLTSLSLYPLDRSRSQARIALFKHALQLRAHDSAATDTTPATDSTPHQDLAGKTMRSSDVGSFVTPSAATKRRKIVLQEPVGASLPSSPVVMGFSNHPRQSLCYMTAPLMGIALGTQYLSNLLLQAVHKKIKKHTRGSFSGAAKGKFAPQQYAHSQRGAAASGRASTKPALTSSQAEAAATVACLECIPEFFTSLRSRFPSPVVPLRDMQHFRNSFRIAAKWHLEELPAEQQDSLDFLRTLLHLVDATPFFVLVRDTLHSMIPDAQDRDLAEPQHELVLDSVGSGDEPTSLSALIFGVMEKQIRHVKRLDLSLPRGTRNTPAKAKAALGHALQQRRFLQCPDVLLVSLLRFQLNKYGRKERLSREVSVPLLLTQRELKGLKPTDALSLRMAVCHHTKGKNVGAGHYKVFYRLHPGLADQKDTSTASDSFESNVMQNDTEVDSSESTDTAVADAWYWFDDLGHGITREGARGPAVPSVRRCSWEFVAERLLKDGYYFVYERTDELSAMEDVTDTVVPRTAPRPARAMSKGPVPLPSSMHEHRTAAPEQSLELLRRADESQSPPARRTRVMSVPDTV